MTAPNTKGNNPLVRSSQDKPQRLFFALWPDDALRQRLVSCSKPLVQTTPGRSVPTENLHITLAFLGNVDARQQDCVERIAEAIVSPSFEFTLDHFGYRPGSRVLWFAPSEVSAPLMLLANVLSAGARECGLSLDARPYRPHLTLMRKVAREPENYSVGALLWPASNFVLVRSVSVPQGVFYDVLREWPLDSVN